MGGTPRFVMSSAVGQGMTQPWSNWNEHSEERSQREDSSFLHLSIYVRAHLVIELSQQLFQGEVDIVIIFLVAVVDVGGDDARAHQEHVHRQLL